MDKDKKSLGWRLFDLGKDVVEENRNKDEGVFTKGAIVGAAAVTMAAGLVGAAVGKVIDVADEAIKERKKKKKEEESSVTQVEDDATIESKYENPENSTGN